MMGLRTWNVHLHMPGRRPGDTGHLLGTYRDLGDAAEDEPDIGSIIFVSLTKYKVVYLAQEGENGGTLIVEPVN